MPRNAEGLLDDIGGVPPEPTTEPAPAPEPILEPAAEPVQADPAPEAIAAPQAEKPNPAASPDRPEGYVPQQALAEARREAKEARDRAAVLEDRTNKLLERFYKEAEPPEPEIDLGPDPDTDPIGALKWSREQQAATIRQQREYEARHQQETAADQQFREAFNTVQGKFQAATQARPEVQDAYNSLIKSYAEELQVAGWSGPQLAQQMQEIESNHIRYMAQNQIEPAEYIEKLARARGWQRPSNPPATANPGADQPRDPSTGQFVSEAAKAAKIATSQERNGSLSSVPGAPVEKMTSKEFASLPEEEIWRRLASAGKNRKQMERDLGFR